jgi:hypothetical protein
MNNYKLIFPIGLLFSVQMATAQVYNYEDGEGPVPPDSVKGLYVGLNLGVYFANSNTARMYAGYGYDRGGFILPFENSWLNQAIQGNPQAINRTSTAVGLAPGEWTFDESDMPLLMEYSGSFLYGAHLRYMFNSDFGVFAEINGTNPVTVGEFTIQAQTASPDPLQNDRFRRFGIRGEEQRLIINLGLHRVMGREAAERKGKVPSILPYIDLGANMTMVRFEENFINLGDLVGTVDLMTILNNQGQFIDLQPNILTGVGFGGFGGVGAQITIGQKFTINIGYVASLEQVKLGELNERGIQHQFVLRAIYM